MANFKRGKPKSARAGCLLCKPHKLQGSCRDHRDRFSDLKRRKGAEARLRDGRCEGA